MKLIKYNYLYPLKYNLFHKSICIKQPQRIHGSVLLFTSDNGKISISKGCHFLRNTTIQSDGGSVFIGEGTFINENAKIVSREKITIGKHCSFGPNVAVYDHDHDYKNAPSTFLTGEIIIGDNVWVGTNAVILRNSIIEDNCVIAAGTVVKGRVTANNMAFNPKRLEMKAIKFIERK